MKVGIPRSLVYYYDGVLWKNFFSNLGIKTVISEPTNKETVKIGESLLDSEACLSIKIFIGHVKSLIGKCDYILVPRIFSIEKNEQVCTNFNSLYDITKNLFPDVKLLNYNIDVDKKKSEVLAYTKLGSEIGASYMASYKAYIDAKNEVKKYFREKIHEQVKKLSSDKLKILIAGHPYNIYDEAVGIDIIKYLESENIDVIYSDLMYRDLYDKYSKNISTDLHFSYNKRVLAAISFFEKQVDGIILLSTFPCGPDSLSNEMVKRNVRKPLLVIKKESFDMTGVITRCEAFLDILKVKNA